MRALVTGPPTLKSTPIVALASSSGNHCSSENRIKRLDFPTEELPISNNLQFIGELLEPDIVEVEGSVQR
jgi:hypothetical protein